MRACLFLWIFLEQTLASQDFHYIQRLEGESVDILCVPQVSKSHSSLLFLRRSFAHSQIVLNISEDGLRADPEIEGRVKIAEQRNFLQTAEITVTLSDLRRTDTGLYICDFSGNPSHQISAKTSLFLLVKAAGEPCSCRTYSLLIHILSLGVGLLLLAGIALILTHKKPDDQQEHQTPDPIYEDMSTVQGSTPTLHRICPPGWTKSDRKTAERTIDPPKGHPMWRRQLVI